METQAAAPATNQIPKTEFVAEDGTVLAQVRMAVDRRMPWLWGSFGNGSGQFVEVWPALPSPTAGVVGTTVGPFGDTDIDLGYFLDSARRRGVRTIYAAYVADPREVDQDGHAAIGDGLVVQFFADGVLHTWRGAPLEEATPAGHPTPQQQEAIDELVETLVADPEYRKLTRKSERDGYAKAGARTGELAEVFRGEHPAVPPNFGWRILQQAQALVQQGARDAYANVEADEPILIEVLRQDDGLAVINDRTARRHHIRDVLFERYGHAPPSALIGRLYDATTR
ncbi:hypothetical protein [Amycolatopsis eburnea]|uniref:Uncharacterized protein n=1 Tax=Amycolatopsis eburnea TaxID=2267691 RepID=A0A3R9EB93_9PSEU|nr:hypothetical protein [Amycolatopsis eburnea]RSD26418.1 hypothetical protein EIY87_00060 [Amycolatopsis eburnea]